jgi:hypothetical protein
MTNRKTIELWVGLFATAAVFAAIIVFLAMAASRGMLKTCEERGGHYTTTGTGRDVICIDDEGKVIGP